MKSAAKNLDRENLNGADASMNFEQLKPHLNRISTLYLRNNKRKVGWIYIEDIALSDVQEVYFVCVQKGRKVMTALEVSDVNSLRPFRENIPVKDIIRIRSSK